MDCAVRLSVLPELVRPSVPALYRSAMSVDTARAKAAVHGLGARRVLSKPMVKEATFAPAASVPEEVAAHEWIALVRALHYGVVALPDDLVASFLKPPDGALDGLWLRHIICLEGDDPREGHVPLVAVVHEPAQHFAIIAFAVHFENVNPQDLVAGCESLERPYWNPFPSHDL